MDRRHFLGVTLALATPTPFPTRRIEAPRGLVCAPPNAFGVQRCTAGIDSGILNVVASGTQQASQWCWAACIEAVFAYYGHPVAQARIVAETWGGIVNLPGSPSQILADLNRSWVDEYGRPFHVQGDAFSANPVTAAQDLAGNAPLIIGTQGHAMVLTALTYDRDGYGNGQVVEAVVRDPWPASPRRRVLSAHEWYGTSFLARIRVYG